MKAARIMVSGIVQGVGFRWWAMSTARELRLSGYAINRDDGRVEILAQGELDAIQQLIRLAREEPTRQRRPGWVDGVEVEWVDPVPGRTGFRAG